MIKRFSGSHPLVMQMLKFGVVGMSAFFIDNIIFWVLIRVADINSYAAIAISFVITLVYNYVLSTKWVFDSKRNGANTLLVFTGLSLVGLVITELVYSLCIEMVFDSVNAGLNDYYELFSKIVASGVAMVFNFITRKLFLESKNK